MTSNTGGDSRRSISMMLLCWRGLPTSTFSNESLLEALFNLKGAPKHTDQLQLLQRNRISCKHVSFTLSLPPSGIPPAPPPLHNHNRPPPPLQRRPRPRIPQPALNGKHKNRQRPRSRRRRPGRSLQPQQNVPRGGDESGRRWSQGERLGGQWCEPGIE